MTEQSIRGFHQDELGDWVAELACGHSQHVRHNPLWQLRPWVQTVAGRTGMVGHTLPCRFCKAATAAEVPQGDGVV